MRPIIFISMIAVVFSALVYKTAIAQSQMLYDPGKNGTWQYYFNPGTMYDLAVTGDTVWLGTERALFQINRRAMQTTKVIQYPSPGGFPARINGEALIVDTNGVVWIAADNLGVLRFNGTWALFTTDHGLGTLRITDIIVGADGSIWCSWNTNSTLQPPGVSRFNGSSWETVVSSQFTSTTIKQIAAIDFSAEGDLWIASHQGVAKYSGGSLTVHNTSPVGEVKNIDAVTSNNVWAARSNGLIHFNGTEWSFHQYNSERLNYRSVHVTPDGKVWALRRGIVVFDGTQWIEYGTQQGLSSWNPTRLRFAPDESPWAIAGISGGSQGYPTMRGGLHSFDGQLWQRHHIGSFFPGTINDLHADDNERMWAITHDGNLHAVELSGNSWQDHPFTIEPVGRFHQLSAVEPTGKVWLSTQHTTHCSLLYCASDYSTFSFNGSQWTDEVLLPGYPYLIYPDKQDNVWFGGNGLVRLNAGTVYTYTKENGGLPGNTIGRLAQMRSEVWAYVQDGTGNNAIPYLRRFDGTTWVEVPDFTTEWPIIVDKQDHLWLAKSSWLIESANGVITEHRVSTEPGGYTRLTYDYDSVFVDQYNRLVATYGKRVSVYDGVNWFYKEFNYADLPLDAPNGSIRNFILGSDSSYWFGTDDGIAVFTPNNLGVTYSVSGKVKSPNGGNLIGATVLVDGQPFIKTDENGNFVVYDLTAGQHTISVQKENLYFSEQTLNIAQSVKNLEFKGQTETKFKVSGFLLNPENLAKPIGAKVIAVNANTGARYEVNASSQLGAYAIELPSGPYTLTAQLDGHVFNQLRIDVNAVLSGVDIHWGLPHDPVIFIPGISGSQLRLAADVPGTTWGKKDLEVWPAELRWINAGSHEYLTLKPGDENNRTLYTDHALRRFLKLNQGYGSIISKFKQAGYLEYETGGNPVFRTSNGCIKEQKGANFFVFPWDWRYGIADVDTKELNLPEDQRHSQLLYEYIKCVGKIHPGKKVIIVAHSMGGLVARKYILEYSASNEHNVSKLITIGTPWLGAPKAVNVILTGDFDWWLINPTLLRKLVEYFPGGHQLLPSRQYFEESNASPLVLLEPSDPYARNHTRIPVGYDDPTYGFAKMLADRYKPTADTPDDYLTEQTFVGNNEELFGEGSFSDWRSDATGIEYHVLYGEGVTADTIGWIEETIKTTRVGRFATQVKWIVPEPQYVMGDSTVPVVSSSRLGDNNLNGSATLYRFKAADWSSLPFGWGDEDTTHLGLTSNERVFSCVIMIINSSQNCLPDASIRHSSTQIEAQPATYLRLWGSKEVIVSDGISTTTILSDTYQPLAGMSYSLLGDYGMVLILQPTKKFTVTVKSEEFFDAVVEYGKGSDAIERRIHFTDVPVTENMIVQLETSHATGSTLIIDSDGNQQPETTILPVSDVGIEAMHDETPPTVNIIHDQASKQVTITAEDTSGVSRIFYSTDGSSFVRYSEVFLPNKETQIVYAQAEDGAGNLSPVISKQLVETTSVNSIFLPIVTR